MSLKQYYDIAKPGMVYGNAIPVICCFLFASKWHVDIWLFLATLVGISLIMASACVFNNVIDRDIDGDMQRTKRRAMVLGQISMAAALVYGVVIGLIGFGVLWLHVNAIATAVAILGFFFYVCMYSMWWKRISAWGTLVGSVSGAVPPVVGYVAVTGRIDLAAIILFGIMAVWQMPHFFAIAIRRRDEYAAARIPVLSVSKGIGATKIQMLGYLIAFALITPMLTVFGYSNVIYLIVSLILSLGWLVMGLKGFRIPDNDPKTVVWAKNMFLTSLIVMMTLFVTIALTPVV